MKLGDFFKTATHCAPVNPKPVDLTLVSKEPTLPGGEKNPHGRTVRAKARGAFVFIGTEETQAARSAARQCAMARAAKLSTKEAPIVADEDEIQVDYLYEIIQRCVREYDEKERTAGDPLFPTASVARSLILEREAVRLVNAYNAYVASEHPEAPPAGADFRGAGHGGEAALQRTA